MKVDIDNPSLFAYSLLVFHHSNTFLQQTDYTAAFTVVENNTYQQITRSVEWHKKEDQ